MQFMSNPEGPKRLKQNISILGLHTTVKILLVLFYLFLVFYTKAPGYGNIVGLNLIFLVKSLLHH
jgi:hypothetical protein